MAGHAHTPLDEIPNNSEQPVKAVAKVKKARAVKGEVIAPVMGRPSSYTQAIAEEIIRRVLAGGTLYKICKSDDMPARDTIYTWLARHKDFADNYARACSIRREQKFEALEEIVDTEEDVYRARLKIDVIKWQLGKEEPTKYGDRLEIDGKQEITHKFEAMTDEQLEAAIQARQN